MNTSEVKKLLAPDSDGTLFHLQMLIGTKTCKDLKQVMGFLMVRTKSPTTLVLFGLLFVWAWSTTMNGLTSRLNSLLDILGKNGINCGAMLIL